jgi:outer membrane protein assembly factor BamB
MRENTLDRFQRLQFAIAVFCVLTVFFMPVSAPAESAIGWLGWRGPNQNGTAEATDLPDTWVPGAEAELWTYPISGRGTPVIANGRVYTLGYRGEGPDLREYIVCLDLNTGELIWERGYNDFISDIIYERYSIGSPTVDPETGNIYFLTSPGLFVGMTPDGETLWEISMMEDFGRLTFPNGRTGAPIVDDDLVIIHAITSNWGSQGPARDRFYAFDKLNGQLVWSSTPGIAPKDSSFSTPVLEWVGDTRVLYAGTGCGNVVAVNARNGDPLWRFHLSSGGINCSVVVHGDKIVAISGKENLDDSTIGRMVAVDKLAYQKADDVKSGEPVVLDSSHELWRNPLGIFTSSPTLVGDRVYQTVATGELHSVDVNTGESKWNLKLSNSQLHASPLYGGGKLYVPMLTGKFYIIQPGEESGEILSEVQLDGNCLGAPAAWDGRVLVHTTEKLYCFGSDAPGDGKAWPKRQPAENIGEPVELQIAPAEVIMGPGEQQEFSIRSLDKNGNVVSNVDNVEWKKFIPPTARVKSEMDANFSGGRLVTKDDAKISAGAFRATLGELSGTIRGRVMPNLPIIEDFESYELGEGDDPFAFPPLAWIGARFKWDVRKRGDSQVFVKLLERILFQRSSSFIGPSSASNYTIEADVMTDGNRRIMSDIGLINQRYLVTLKGNWQQIEISSNHDRIKESVPFKWKAKQWYRLKCRVDTHDEGSGVVRAKAWPRGEEEPADWNIEMNHRHAHQNGAPGLFGFSPQSQKPVFIDNIKVYSNK